MSKRLKGLRPSPGVLIGVVALVAALAGTAVAGSDVQSSALNKKKAKQIATKQINKLAPGLSVAQADSANSANTANSADTANTANSADTANTANSANTVADGAVTTPKLANGAVRASKLGTLTRRSASTELTVGEVDSVTATCNPGERAISGGADTAGVGTVDGWVLRRSAPNSQATEWAAQAENNTAAAGNLVAFVMCLQAG